MTLNDRMRKFARKNRRAGKLRIAGGYYVATAHGHLMAFRREPPHTDDGSLDASFDVSTPPEFDRFEALGPSIKHLLAGILCFRVAGETDRCRAVSRHGIEFLRDVLEHETEAFEQPREGLLHEMIGDHRLIGGLDDHESSYTTATDRYHGAERNEHWQQNDDFDDLMLYVLELADSIDYGISDDTREQIYRLSLEARIEFKRDHLPAIIERVVDDGNWESDIF